MELQISLEIIGISAFWVTGFLTAVLTANTDTLLARSILHRLIPIDLCGNDATNQYFDTEPH